MLSRVEMDRNADLPGGVSAEKGRWIWPDASCGQNEWVAFRHGFTLSRDAGKAIARVASADKYWLWMNGELLVREGGLKSGPTPTDWYVDEVEVSAALRQGRNQFAILVWHFGRDGASHRNAKQGGLFFELRTRETMVVSNRSWKARRHPAFGHTGGGTSVTLAEQGIDFDARLDLPGWTAADFDDTSWPAARELGRPPAPPWGSLVPRAIPLWRDGVPARYVNESELAVPIVGPRIIIGKLPANLQVYPRFEIRAPAGKEVFVQIERDKKCTRYISREGRQEFEVPAWGNGHFVTYSIPEGVEVLRLGYRETGYDADLTGLFEGSDQALNVLWRKAARTSYLCLRDSFMDCPDRERSGWPGDAANILEVTLRALDRRSDRMIVKAFRELAGWASPEGNLWGAVPTSRFAGSFREFPSQTLLLLGFGLLAYWRHTADLELIRALYPAVRRYVLELYVVKDGFVQHRGPWELKWVEGVQAWYDWGTNIDDESLDQLLYFQALESLGACAMALGKVEDSQRCEDLRQEMRQAFKEQIWQQDIQACRSPRHTGPPDDRVQALAIVTGMVPAQCWPALADTLEKNAWCSVYLERFPLEALVLAGRPESALRRLGQRFSAEIASTYTTLPEEFGQDSNHAWGGAAIVILAEKLMGISLAEQGFRKVNFRPALGGLEFAECKIPTIHGKLRLGFRRHASGTTFRLEVPPNVVVSLPVGGEERAYGEGSWTVESPRSLSA